MNTESYPNRCLPTLQEYETIIDFTTDSPLFSLLPEPCTTTEATSINPQSQASMSAIVESQYNTSNPPRAQYWRPSSQLIKKLRFLHEKAYCTISLCSVLLLWQITLPI